MTREEYIELRTKINWEGGIAEYFTNYSSDISNLPESFAQAVKDFIDKYQIVLDKLDDLDTGFAISDEEWEC